MTLEQIHKFQYYINSEISTIEHKIINPDTLSDLEFKSYLNRYTFLFRLKNTLSSYCLSEVDFFDELKASHGIKRVDLNAEIIYNKYFSSRTKRSYASICDELNKRFYNNLNS